MRALLLVAVMLVAGCVAPATEAPDADASARVIPWGLEACIFVNWFVHVEADALRPHLPEGFEPDVESALPIPLAPDKAYLGFEAFRCASGAGIGREIVDLEYASLFTSAMPPPELRREGVGLYIVKWDTLVPDADRRALLQEAGLPVRDGSAEAHHMQGPSGTLAVTGAFELEGLGTFRYEGGVPHFTGDGGGDGIRFLEFMQANGGLAVWDARFALDAFSVGEGIVQVPSDSWAAEVIGSDVARAAYFAGRWTFFEGSLTLPQTS